MSQTEQLIRMRIEILNNESDRSKDEIFKIKLSDAEVLALNTLYPYDKTKKCIDEDNLRLKNWCVRCAIELYKRKDTSGVLNYSENGLNITYMKGLLPDELINELVPKAGAIK